jgi:hypothetical protein
MACRTFRLTATAEGVYGRVCFPYLRFKVREVYPSFGGRKSWRVDVSFDIFTSATMKNVVFWDVTPYGVPSQKTAFFMAC